MSEASKVVKSHPVQPRTVELTKPQLLELADSLIEISLKDKTLGFNPRERADAAKLLAKMSIVRSPKSVTAVSLSNLLIKLRQIAKDMPSYVVVKCSGNFPDTDRYICTEKVPITSATLMITESSRSFSVEQKQPTLPACECKIRGTATRGSGGSRLEMMYEQNRRHGQGGHGSVDPCDD